MTNEAKGIGADLARVIPGQVLLHSTMTGMRMAAPLLVLGQGLGAAAAGAVVALFAFTQIFLALPAGRFADRHGLGLPMTFSAAGGATAAVLAALWPVFPVLCVSAMLAGGSVGVGTIALQRHVGRLAHGTTQLKQAFSWLSLSPAASNFLGPVVAGLVIDRFGFRAAFAVLALLAALGWLWLRGAREAQQEPTGAARPGTAWGLWRDPLFRRLMLLNWFFSASWDVHSFMVPVLAHERGLPASVIGSILGAFAISAALIRLVLPVIAKRLHEWVLIMGAMALTGLVFALYPFTTSALTMGMCAALAGMGLGAVQPMIMSMMHQVTPPARHGQAVAMRILLINASSVAMPMLFGVAGAAAGASGVFWAMGLIIGVGSRLAVGLKDVGEQHK